LKLAGLAAIAYVIMSRPARARGLKLHCDNNVSAATASRPARARGLKPSLQVHEAPAALVAPRAGAWIETGAC